jgi:MarR family transcriptional regulator, organic hydroperoxide resistance regulator
MPVRSTAASSEPLPSGRTLGPVLDFMRVLWELDHALQSASKRMEGRIGVTGPQRLVVRILGRYPGISAGEVSALLHLHPSTLTGVLKRLAVRGLVRRRPDPSDGRRVLLELTARGRTLDASRGGTIEAAVRRALDRLDPKTAAAARAIAGALVVELERMG